MRVCALARVDASLTTSGSRIVNTRLRPGSICLTVNPDPSWDWPARPPRRDPASPSDAASAGSPPVVDAIEAVPARPGVAPHLHDPRPDSLRWCSDRQRARCGEPRPGDNVITRHDGRDLFVRGAPMGFPAPVDGTTERRRGDREHSAPRKPTPTPPDTVLLRLMNLPPWKTAVGISVATRRLDYVVGSAYSKTMAGIPVSATGPVLSPYMAGSGALVSGSPSSTRRLMAFPSPVIQ